MPIVLRTGSFNLLEPLGPVQACNGIALPSSFTSYININIFISYCTFVLDKESSNWLDGLFSRHVYLLIWQVKMENGTTPRNIFNMLVNLFQERCTNFMHYMHICCYYSSKKRIICLTHAHFPKDSFLLSCKTYLHGHIPLSN